MAWEGSTRHATLPPDWAARVAAAHKKARTKRHPEGKGQCQKVWRDFRGFHRCTQPGADVDHKTDRLNHDDLQVLCVRHHQLKTLGEAQQGKAEAAAARTRRRHTDAHPGRRRQ